MREHFCAVYVAADDHRHAHGANLGVSAEPYLLAGGFPPLACNGDVALVERLIQSGARIPWSATSRVTQYGLALPSPVLHTALNGDSKLVDGRPATEIDLA